MQMQRAATFEAWCSICCSLDTYRWADGDKAPPPVDDSSKKGKGKDKKNSSVMHVQGDSDDDSQGAMIAGQGHGGEGRGRGANRGRGRGGRGGARGGGNGGGQTQTTSPGQTPSQSTTSQPVRFRCFNCQEPGHSVTECPHQRDEPRISANMEAARVRREQRNQAQAGTGGLPPPYTPHQTLSQPPAYQPYGYIQYSYPPPQMQQMATQPQPPPQQQAAAAAAPAQASGNAGAPARP